MSPGRGPLDRHGGGHSNYEAAVIAQVLDALIGREKPSDPAEGEPAVASQALDDLLAHAIAELSRHPGAPLFAGATSPLLGNGVLRGLLSARRDRPNPPDVGHVDERL